MAGKEFESAAALDQFLEQSPERQALATLHERAMANQQPWLTFIQELSRRLPGHHVSNGTHSYWLEPTFVAVIGVPEGVDDYPDHRVVVMASILAPVYHVYEIIEHPRRIRHSFGDAVTSIVAAIEAAMAQHLGYQRVGAREGAIRLPKLQIGSLPDYQSTLVDALFSDYRW